MNRYRFKTRSVADYRPLAFNPHYPWWCSGIAGDDNYATIVCYLPTGEDLYKYWDDAFDIDIEEDVEVVFTSRFSRPKWFVGEEGGRTNEVH